MEASQMGFFWRIVGRIAFDFGGGNWDVFADVESRRSHHRPELERQFTPTTTGEVTERCPASRRPVCRTAPEQFGQECQNGFGAQPGGRQRNSSGNSELDGHVVTKSWYGNLNHLEPPRTT